MKSDASHSKKLFPSYECFSDARASWEELFVTWSLPIDCSSNGLVWRLQFPAQTFPSFHHSVYFHFHIKNPIKFSIDTIHYFDFLTVHLLSRNKSVFSHFKYNFWEKVPCNECLHQMNVDITMTDYLLVVWQIFGNGSKNRQNNLFSVAVQDFLRGKYSSSYTNSWESLWQTPSVGATNTLIYIHS